MPDPVTPDTPSTPPDGGADVGPDTLADVASRETGRIGQVRDIEGANRKKFQGALTQGVAGHRVISGARSRVEAEISRGRDWQRDAEELFTQLGGDEAELVAAKKEATETRDTTLHTEFREVANYYQQAQDLLRSLAEAGGVITPHILVTKAMEHLRTWGSDIQVGGAPMSIGKYVADKFADRVIAVVNSRDPEQVDTLIGEVTAAINADGQVLNSDKHLIRQPVREALRPLRTVLRLTKDLNTLSAAGILGVLGTVPNEETRAAIFADYKQVVQAGHSASAQVDVGGRQFDLYVTESGALEPEDVVRELGQVCQQEEENEPTNHITGVHVRTDADVATLMKDLSTGQVLAGSKLDGTGEIHVYGITNSDDVRVDGIAEGDKADFLAHPMKYMAHEFTFIPMPIGGGDDDGTDVAS